MNVGIFGCAALAASLVACGAPTVPRIVDGREVRGRFVMPAAYALYATAADAEAHGDLEAALQGYETAARVDPESAEIWTRIGGVACRMPGERPSETTPEAAFSKAEALDAAYGPLWAARARCALGRGDIAAADASARRALAIDPKNEDVMLVFAEAAERAGDIDRARRALREMTVLFPGRAAGWRSFALFSRKNGDLAAAARADEALRGLAPIEEAPIAVTRPTLVDIDDALKRDALPEARRLATRARLDPGALAARAVALGRTKIAEEQGALVAGGDPSNTSAAIALAVARDLRGDGAGVAAALRAIAAMPAPPTPIARLLFAELLARRVGLDAASAWIGPYLPPPDANDALLGVVTARVSTMLHAP